MGHLKREQRLLIWSRSWESQPIIRHRSAGGWGDHCGGAGRAFYPQDVLPARNFYNLCDSVLCDRAHHDQWPVRSPVRWSTTRARGPGYPARERCRIMKIPWRLVVPGLHMYADLCDQSYRFAPTGRATKGIARVAIKSMALAESMPSRLRRKRTPSGLPFPWVQSI